MLEYGIFNDLTDEELAEIHNTPDSWLGTVIGGPIRGRDDEQYAILRVHEINAWRRDYRNDEKKSAEPLIVDQRFSRPVDVKFRRREVIYGEWYD